MLWRSADRQGREFFTGLCLGTIRGDYSAVPVAGWRYDTENWQLQLAYPASHVEWRTGSAARLFASWSLVGNQWQILDSDLQNRSDVHFEAQRLRLGFLLQVTGYGEVVLYWQRLIDQQLDYLARDGGQLSLQPDPVSGWRLGYRYLY